MPVSGIVITFEAPVADCGETIEALRQLPEFEAGEARGHRLAAVIDSATPQRDREIYRTIEQMPRVCDVFLALVGFEDDQPNEDLA